MPVKNIIIPRETNKRPVNFKIGKVYKMIAGYHTDEPYYVFIEDAGKDFIQTSIPNKHSLMIKYPSHEWKYHIQRMTCIGQIDNHKIKQLLYQPNLLTHNK